MIGRNQQIIQGRGSGRELRSVLEEQSPKSVFLVTGKASYAISGAERLIEVTASNVEAVRFSDFGDNLKLGEVVEAVRLFRDHNCDSVIGLGGGSVMDMAKAVSLLGTQAAEAADFISGEMTPAARQTGSVMIPTTAGTGSESTHFSVIYVNGLKRSLSHESMLPDVAILDAALTDSMPPGVTACTGLDALCQGIESFWSIGSTDESRALSAEAIRLALSNIVAAVKRPDPGLRDNMLQAANLSGQAINIARTTVAHAASYPLTARYGIPHGHAVALILPHLLFFNCTAAAERVTDPRGFEFVSRNLTELLSLLGAKSSTAARDNLINTVTTLGLETRLSQIGVESEAITSLADECLASDRSKNNPIAIGPDDLQSMLRAML